MRKSIILLGLLTGLVSAPAVSQQASGGGPADAGGAVKSESYGVPGQSTDPMSGYLQQKSLNNLTNQQVGSTTAGRRVRSRQALPSELTVGATINDKTDVAIGKIEKVDPDGIVIATTAGKVKIPAEAIGHDKAGLLLDTSKADFDQIVAKANSTPAG